jgi:hypothetical protein
LREIKVFASEATPTGKNRKICNKQLHSDTQSGETLHIKVTEIIPKFTFLGRNLDEALNLQKQHEDLLLNIQVSCSIIEKLS